MNQPTDPLFAPARDIDPIPGLGAIAHHYDLLLCDLWGVVHNGREAFSDACDALTRFRAQGGRVILITNAPRPSDVIPRQLDRLGVPTDAWDRIVTSGDVTRAEIAKRAPGRVYVIGPQKDLGLLTGFDVQSAPLDMADFILCTGLVDDLHETPEDYRELLVQGAARGLDLICANPDKIVRFGDQILYCAGALAEIYAELGGRIVMAGKPFGPIYEACYALLPELGLSRRSKSGATSARILAIGDGPGTDILGAQNQGLDWLFVADGIASHAPTLLLDAGMGHVGNIGDGSQKKDATASYAIASLKY